MPKIANSPFLRLALALTLAAALASGCSTTRVVPGNSAPIAAPPPSAMPAEGSSPGTASPPSNDITNAQRRFDLASPVPFDPAVRRGRLENGLRYYVRENGRPENRAALRLVVNAGSILEDDDQKGLAHFVEHMAFNGTKRFEKLELVNYLERIGMRFGPDINAYTSFDETVYMLEVPTDDPEILETGLTILEEWASAVTFEGEEIDKERGVVVEEWRLGRGAGSRIRDQQLPVLFHGSRYAERKTIGDKSILENAPYEALRRFYRDWYRPDNMALIVVGDVDPSAIVARIRERFARLEGPESPRERIEFPVPDHDETLVSVVTDPEATGTRVTVGFKRPPVPTRTVGAVRDSLIDSLYDAMMGARLSELARAADPPFQFASASSGSLGRTKSVYQLSASVRNGGVERGLRALLTEVRRVEEHGFSQTELERVKADILRSIEVQYEERDKRESGRVARSFVTSFLEDQPVPSVAYVRDLAQALIPQVTLAEINGRADQWITDTNRVFLVSGPEADDAPLPDEERLLALFDEVRQLGVTPWVDEVRDEPLVPNPPKPGRIVREESHEDVGVTRWVLSNGATVLLKPTDFKNDEIVLRATSFGGTSLAADEDLLSAEMASPLTDAMGAGEFSAIELQKKLAGKAVSARVFLGDLTEGASASSSVGDLETMFTLLHLRMTSPRLDEEAASGFLTRMTGWLENREASPDWHFGVKLGEVLSQGHPRARPLTEDRIDEIDVEKALDFYRDRFADASDFIFTIVGSFELDTIRPLVTRWIGGLPGTAREESWRDNGIEPPEGIVRFEVLRGIEPKAQVNMIFHGEAGWSHEESALVRSMSRVLNIRLRELLREELSGVYGVSVRGNLERLPRERYSVSVSFSCDPERVDELVGAVIGEIEDFRESGPDAERVEKVREIELREREVQLERNGAWASSIQSLELDGLPLTKILDGEQRIIGMKAGDLHRVAKMTLGGENYVLGVLLPGEDAQSEPAPAAAGAGGR